MIIGIGIDSVEIKRFIPWATYSQEQLTRFLSLQEIEYCLKSTTKSAERFAARFAAREAFFKAFSQAAPNHTLTLMAVSRLIQVKSTNNGSPELLIDWKTLSQKTGITSNSKLKCWVAITHTDTCATAMIILENCR